MEHRHFESRERPQAGGYELRLGMPERMEFAPSAERSLELAAVIEAADLRDRGLRLLAIGVGDHTLDRIARRGRLTASIGPMLGVADMNVSRSTDITRESH